MEKNEPRYRDQLGPVLMVVLIVFLNLFSRSLFSPLLVEIEETFQISHSEASRFFLLISIGYAGSLLLSGYVSAAIQHRGAIILSITVIGAGQIIIALTSSLLLIYISLLIIGVGAGLYAPSGVPVITSIVEKKNWGRAISLHEMGPNLGFVTAPLWATLITFFLPWRAVFLLTGSICIAVGFLYMRFFEIGRFPGETPTFTIIGTVFRNPSFWILLSFFLFAAGGAQGVYSLLPTYLITEVGMNKVRANNLVSLSRIPPVFLVMTVGLLYEKFGPVRTIFSLMLLAASSMVFLGIARDGAVPLAVFLQPTCTAMFFPAGLAALSSIGPESSRNIILATLLAFVTLLGMGLAPLFFGYMGDYYSFSLGFLLFGLSGFLIIPLVMKLRV